MQYLGTSSARRKKSKVTLPEIAAIIGIIYLTAYALATSRFKMTSGI